MTEERTALAVRLRQVQWELDEAAFRVGAGEYGRSDCDRLVEVLRELAGAVGEYAERRPLRTAR